MSIEKDYIVGIDVSHHQGDIAWDKVATENDIAFAWIKATEGIDWVDPKFMRNWDEAAEAGILRGAYHFARPAVGRDPVAEADHLLEALSRVPASDFDLPPVLDLEVHDGKMSATKLSEWARTFLDKVRDEIGALPVVYLSPGFWAGPLGSTDLLRPYHLWLAHYTDGTPTVPRAWGSPAAWQFTDEGRVVGIAGNVDMNISDPKRFFDLLTADNLVGAPVPGDQPAKSGIENPDTAPGRPQPAPTSKPTTERHTLRMHSKGDAVRELQEALPKITPGVTLTVDGDFGPATDDAVRKFQAHNNLARDGIVGPATWTVIDRKLDEVTKPTPAPEPSPDKRMPIREVQQRLVDLGWPIAVDGEFGPTTSLAVRHFQEAFSFWNLDIDGEVGVRTEAALIHAAGRGGRASENFYFREFASKGNRWIRVHRELIRSAETKRRHQGHPEKIISAYRDPEHNARVKGASNSEHLYGRAYDCPPTVKRDTVKAWKVFAGIGWNTSSGKVSHGDRRDVGDKPGSLSSPVLWSYNR